MEPHYSTRFPVQCPIAFVGDQIRGEGNAVDFSIEGCKVESNMSLQVGHYLCVLVHIPGDDPPLEVDLAAVRWSREGKFGLELLYMRPEEYERLCSFVDTMQMLPSY